MTANELMVLLREIADRKGLNMTFTCLADHFQELRLNSGMRLLDSSDWKHFFRELAIAARMSPDFSVPASAEADTRLQLMRPASQRRWDEFCPDCGHIHADENECQFPIGGGRKCLCERRVPA